MKNIEDFIKQAVAKKITRWNIHSCSICGYQCGFQINGEDVKYDSGCYCSIQPFRQSSWEELAEHYNNNQRENNPDIKQETLDEMDKFWGF